MSVYKPKTSPFYHFDFWVGGVRFSGSTQLSDRAKAKQIEKQERVKAKAEVERRKSDAAAPLTISRAANRYFDEVGAHHAVPRTTLIYLNSLVQYFGPGRRLDEITDSDVARLVAWRRAQTVRGRTGPKAKVVSNATVNRSAIEPLQKIFNRAIEIWGEAIPKPPRWKEHILPEPKERIREVRHSEEALMEAVREDYRPLIAFARESGLRMNECLMPKSAVDLAGGWVHVIGKGQKIIAQPITKTMRAILEVAMTNPTDFVFAYKADRAVRGPGGYVRGTLRPITISGLKTLWRRSRTGKGARLPADLRFHDLRHDFATKLLRETGNLKMVSEALSHSKIDTTMKYAHVLKEELRAGMEAASQARARARTG